MNKREIIFSVDGANANAAVSDARNQQVRNFGSNRLRTPQGLFRG